MIAVLERLINFLLNSCTVLSISAKKTFLEGTM